MPENHLREGGVLLFIQVKSGFQSKHICVPWGHEIQRQTHKILPRTLAVLLICPLNLRNQKIKSVYKKLLRNQSVSECAQNRSLAFPMFSICILSWPLCVLHVFIFSSVYGHNLMPPSSLGWWNRQQPLLANEMWVPVLQLHQGACSSSLHPLQLNRWLVDQTTQCCVQEAETQMFSSQIFKYFSYWPPAKHKWGIFIWKTVGSSWLCITWKPCVEEELCSASMDPPAAVPLSHVEKPRGYLWLPGLVAIDFWTALLSTGCFLRRENKQRPCQICMAVQWLLPAALQDAPLPPSKEEDQKICVAFAWTSRERHTSWALSPLLNTACLCLLDIGMVFSHPCWILHKCSQQAREER